MIPVILSGGAGSRLWPMSRKNFPKQFCSILDSNLILKSYDRLKDLGEVIILSSSNLRHLTLNLIEKENLKIQTPFFEPTAKNTACAILAICRYFELHKKSDQVLAIFPADHYIPETDLFHSYIKFAEEVSKSVDVVTLGIRPTYPATAYGYIQISSNQKWENKNFEAFKIYNFHEKPDLLTASNYFASGACYWNAGIFVFQIEKILKAFSKLHPKMYQEFQKLKLDLSNLEEIYANIESISFDVCIMEKIESKACIPCKLEWSDLGSWDEIAKAQVPNLTKSNELLIESHNNFIYQSAEKTTALIGVDDLLVLDTADALLISKKSESQKVKQVVEHLQKTKPKLVEDHIFENTFWGQFTNIKEDTNYKVKHISVMPGKRLSLQSHKQRAEHWIVVKGIATVILDDKKLNLQIGESIYIPIHAKHRLINEQESILELIEVQVGSYLGSDDIQRFEDDYGRK